MLTARYADAFAYAARLHDDQTRKGSDTPYIAHLLAVSALVLELGGTEDQAIAALLHDAVEDQGGMPIAAEIRDRFGDDVARMVLDCSDTHEQPKPPWQARKEAFIAALPTKSPDSLLVALADKVHNAESIAADLDGLGPAVWDRFKGGRDGTIWYYQEVTAIFEGLVSGALTDRLQRLTERMQDP
jgi:(p)ppGpp synthase/HD superfamily hydrolase